MQDMIKRIVEMDKKARDITTEAQTARVKAERDIDARRRMIHNDLLNRARERLKVNEKTEREIAEKSWLTVSEQHEGISRKLTEEYEKYGDRWVSEIVGRVLGE